MKKFIVSLFSNRFGIVLATLNVCCFVSKGKFLLEYPLDINLYCFNLPAVISTLLSLEIVKIFQHKLSFTAETSLANAFFVFFIVLQWLFIAWSAKTIARKFRRAES
jgi:hypothetical protein